MVGRFVESEKRISVRVSAWSSARMETRPTMVLLMGFEPMQCDTQKVIGEVGE